ncbi:MAG: hypothetical protein P8X86_16930 [Desulfofustis sp.]
MEKDERIAQLRTTYLVPDNHGASDYFSLIRELLNYKESDPAVQTHIHQIYSLVEDEIISNQGAPVNEINFGTSGWRGILGKDVFKKSPVSCPLRYSNSKPLFPSISPPRITLSITVATNSMQLTGVRQPPS